jgi:hypothetical protein
MRANPASPAALTRSAPSRSRERQGWAITGPDQSGSTPPAVLPGTWRAGGSIPLRWPATSRPKLLGHSWRHFSPIGHLVDSGRTVWPHWPSQTKTGCQMLTTAEANRLLEMPKVLVEKGNISFPSCGTLLLLEAKSSEGHEQFLFDVNRKGQIRLTKCTFQERYANAERLVRLDIDGPTHTNPDGEQVPCPHLHVYREGYELKWAVPAPHELIHSDLVKVFYSFLRFCNVHSIPDVQRPIG